mmetsp:Transcript_57945/g.152611  ORF Transcript_57945/g.152611 Transcript_57945/m.152611 type:complete len:139 (-) Transcript_57945:129-545(-)
MIAPGTSAKLRRFLELNPTVPRDRVFVDDSENYEAFKAMNFGSLDVDLPGRENVKMRAPDLGGVGGWLDYLGNVFALSPMREGEEGVPKGVKLLGGTFVVGRGLEEGDKGRVLFAHADRLPGDYPRPGAVLGAVEALP